MHFLYIKPYKDEKDKEMAFTYEGKIHKMCPCTNASRSLMSESQSRRVSLSLKMKL